ncbi:MAG: ATP-binding protein, partial [Isosphaeraceae bacterium]
MWLPYWNLRFDPFTATPPTFVRMPAHEEAIARLVTVVEAGERFVVVRGAEGVGKSVVLHQALREIRGPSRRPVWASAPPDVESLCVSLASQLTGQPVRAGGRGGSWKALIDAVKVCHLQKVHPILILDELHAAGSDVGTETIERLSHVGSLAGRLTVWASQRDADPPDVIGGGSGAWRLSVRVTSLTYA